jgi:methionyl aminopeptidase
MREVGKFVTECLDQIQSKHLHAGFTTRDIAWFVRDYCLAHNLINAQKGYHGFPGDCCTSLNEVMCHGIPSSTGILHRGDLLKVDITFIKDGYYGDACRTFIIPGANYDSSPVANVARCALEIGVEAAQPGCFLGDIGEQIEKYVKEAGMSVARDFVGHGIHTEFHTEPQVSHVKDHAYRDRKIILEPGMTFTIEPIICQKKPKYKILEDGWTVVTRDKGLSAQFEATIGITENGNEIFCS